MNTASSATRLLRSTRVARLFRMLSDGLIPPADCLRLNYAPRYTPMTVRFDGKPFRLTDATSFIHIYREIFKDRVYDFRVTSPNPVILDVGANLGLAAIYWQRQWPGLDVTCFEPDPTIFELLSWNLSQRRFEDAKLIGKAVAGFCGAAAFRSEGGASGRLSDEHGSLAVDCIRLGPYLQRRIDLLKLDIEGAEAEVLEDCFEQLCNVQNLFVEYHSFRDLPQRLNRILELVQEAGFRYYIKTEFCPPSPMSCAEFNDGMDLQLSIFCTRL